MDDRAGLIAGFLGETRWARAVQQPLAGDASARRYYRLILPETGETSVLMDAPPAHGEDIRPFVRIAEVLTQAGFSAPEIMHQDAANGLLLLEDLGDAVFAHLIPDDPTVEERLYVAAVDVLVALNGKEPPPNLVRFTPKLMAEQASLIYEHYVEHTGQKNAFCAELESVLADNLMGPEVLILRDYHAENLIWLPERQDIARVGLLDFQDAMAGPAGYDLVSLLYDARRDISVDLADRMTRRFIEATDLDPVAFQACQAALCAQRNLRILGIFARLSRMQGMTRYIELIPRVWNHVITALNHPKLHRLAHVVRNDLPPPTPEHLNFLRAQCNSNPQ